jgi:alpha-amylase/alpha-mannosidase (GH57 family)
MYWANFLHIYQPANQRKDVLDAVIAQCYRPLIEHIHKSKNVRLTLNINASLVEQFHEHGHDDLIDMLKESGKQGKIEFTSSAKFHAFLPLLPKEEIINQIKINDETNRFYLGDAYKPIGFFSPEMGYSKILPPIIEQLGYKWMILDEITAYGEINRVDYSKIYKIKGTNINAFFRERRVSNLIMSAVVRSKETLIGAMKDDMNSGKYLITAMDGETFGHHRPGLEKMLFKIFETPEFNLVTISELYKYYKDTVEVSPVDSTWASSKQDIDKGIQFLSWNDPSNIIHGWQWELIHLVQNKVNKISESHPQYREVRKSMDRALASDHLWWASAKPWWSVEMIEDGAFRLLETLRMIPDSPQSDLSEASELYEKIVSTAFNWQRSGKIYQMMTEQNSILRIPFKERTIGKGGAEVGVYHAIISLIKGLEEKATERKEYEKAILWRDAIYKLENRLDIYDTVNAIDLMRTEIPNSEVEEVIERYKDKYREIRGGQVEQRGS